MERSGIEFVVEGLNKFLDGMNKAATVNNQMAAALVRLAGISGSASGAIIQLAQSVSVLDPKIGIVVYLLGTLAGGLLNMAKTVGGIVSSAIQGLMNLFQGLARAAEAVIRPVANMVANVLNAINPFRMLADLLDRIAYISLGILTADVFRFISRSLVDVAKSAFEAAANFQLLHLRLQGLIARDIIQGLNDDQLATANFKQILADAAGPAKELFNWVRQIAVTTPFTVETLSNAFQLAKAYSLDTETAKALIVATGNFTAGMGLESNVMERVITNLGQMIQQGKVTGTELRDLARGAYVPITEVLGVMAKRHNVSVEAMRKMVQTAQAGSKAGRAYVQEFLQAFILVANRDFPQAMERMAATFPGLISNVTDFIQAVLGFSVLGPAVDSLTSKFGKLFIDILGDPRVLESADKLGAELKDLVESLFPPNLTAKTIVDKVVESVDHLIQLIRDLRAGDWQKIMQNLGAPQWVIDSIDNLKDAFNNFKAFWDQNGEALLSILNRVLDAIGLKNFNPTNTLEDVTGGIKDFSQWLIDHGPEIVTNMDSIAKSIEHFVRVTIPLLSGTAQMTIGPNATELDKLAVTLNRLYESVLKIGKAFNSVFGPAMDLLGESLKIFGVNASGTDAILKIFVGTLSLLAALLAGLINEFAVVVKVFSDAAEQFAIAMALIINGFEQLKSGNYAEGINQIFIGIQTAIQGFITFLSIPLAAILGFIEGVVSYFRNLSEQLVGHSIIPEMMSAISSTILGGLANIAGALPGLMASIFVPFVQLSVDLENIMRVIAKMFFQRAYGWIQQIIQGMQTAMPGVIEALHKLIAMIQATIVGIVIPITWGKPGKFPYGGGGGRDGGGSHPFRQHGGDVMAGLPSIVGERGWEMFIPKVSGTILSHLDSLKMLSSLAAVQSNMLQPILGVPSSISNTTNYNVSVNANYAATQSPITVSQDIDAILSKVRL